MATTKKSKRESLSTSDYSYIDASIVEKGGTIKRNRAKWLQGQIYQNMIAALKQQRGPLARDLTAKEIKRILCLPISDRQIRYHKSAVETAAAPPPPPIR